MEKFIPAVQEICCYHPKTKMQVVLTSTNEKTLKDAEDELLPILERHYINHLSEKEIHG